MTDTEMVKKYVADARALRTETFEEEQARMAKKYLDDALALRRSRDRHRRLGWMDSANSLDVEARSRIGLARLWFKRENKNGNDG